MKSETSACGKCDSGCRRDPKIQRELCEHTFREAASKSGREVIEIAAPESVNFEPSSLQCDGMSLLIIAVC
jgi:hypothetical protein